jgi:ABC-type Na+ efflux pump permease subunit
MEQLAEMLRTDTFVVLIAIIIILLIIICIYNIIKLKNITKKYNDFMIKLGNGKNIEEDLQQFMNRVERVEIRSAELTNYCQNLDNNMMKCIQKVGIVRYSAFKDTGSDLSFALAMLDEENSGVVLNGIYSREMSNIYAKPIEAGKTSYTLTKEEQEALEKAMNNTQGN